MTDSKNAAISTARERAHKLAIAKADYLGSRFDTLCRAYVDARLEHDDGTLMAELDALAGELARGDVERRERQLEARRAKRAAKAPAGTGGTR